MNIPLSPAGEARQEEQRGQYLASMPRKIDCLNLLLEAKARNPENAAAMAALMAMVHQLCGSAALHACDTLKNAAEHCRNQLQSATEPDADSTNAAMGPLLDEMRRLVDAEPNTETDS